MPAIHLNAQRFLEAHGHELRRSPELEQWYVWNGSWWEQDRLDRVLEWRRTASTICASGSPKLTGPTSTRRRSSHYQASAKAGRRDSLLSVAGTDPDIVVSVDELDNQPLLLACRNGTVNLATGELRAARHGDLLTRGVETSTTTPRPFPRFWLDFLDTIFAGDVDLIAYVQRLLGYCVTGVVAEHIVPVFCGAGANGKSTLLGVMQDLLGDHAITAPEGLVIQTAREAHPERLAALRGRRLVVSDELEERAVLAESMVKMLSGGDTISAREVYGRRFNFRPTHKIVLATNHRPRVHGTDFAIWRRLRVVPFGVKIDADRQDPALRRTLIDDHGPAVLAWLVEGARSWHREGLQEVEAVRSATEDYRHNEDVFGAWVEDCTVPAEGVRTKVGDLWESWRTWCEGSNERPGRKQASALVPDPPRHGDRDAPRIPHDQGNRPAGEVW